MSFHFSIYVYVARFLPPTVGLVVFKKSDSSFNQHTVRIYFYFLQEVWLFDNTFNKLNVECCRQISWDDFKLALSGFSYTAEPDVDNLTSHGLVITNNMSSGGGTISVSRSMPNIIKTQFLYLRVYRSLNSFHRIVSLKTQMRTCIHSMWLQ